MEHICSDSYISQISKTKVLDHQETLRLARLAKCGDIEARNKIIEGNLKFVTKIATSYKDKGLPLDDLINEGSLGLISATERFDPDSGNSFLTYAKFWIHQSIALALKDKARLIRIPTNKVEKLTKIHKCLTKLGSLTDEEITIADISKETGIEPEEVIFCLSIKDDAASLDVPIQGVKDKTLLDTIVSIFPGPEQSAVDLDFLSQVDGILLSLPERHREIIIRRYGLFNTKVQSLDDISKIYGITRERVRQIEYAALKKLKSNPMTEELRIYLNAS